jgi:hypothetical protein
MLKSNLSTRPFYNDRLVSVVIAAIAVGAVALTAFNATALRSLSAQRSDFSRKIDADAAETRRLEVRTAELHGTVDFAGMKALWNDAHEANDLIDKRTFSWTAFLGVIERTLPYGARLVEVAPKPEKSVMHLEIVVVCQTTDDLRLLVEAMEKTGVFSDVFPADSSPNDDGTETSLIRAVYLAPPAAPAPPPAGAKKTGKGQP